MKKITKCVAILLAISLVFFFIPAVGGAEGVGSVKNLEPGWIRIYGTGMDDYGSEATTDSNNNVIVIGRTVYSHKIINKFIIKYSSRGDLLWAINETELREIRDVTTDRYNYIIVAGSVNDYPATKLAIRRYNPDGKSLWTREWLNSCSYGQSVATDSNNNVLVTGYAEDESHDYILTMKYDEEGNLLWYRTYDGGDLDLSGGVTTDSNNNVIVAGCSIYYPWEAEYFVLIKYDSQGNLLWRIREEGSKGASVATDQYNNIIAVIASETGWVFPNFTIKKYSPDGKLLWTREWSVSPSYGFDVAVDSGNNIIATGMAARGGNPNNGYDTMMIKYDEEGNLLWVKTYEGINYSVSGVTIDSRDKVIITGSSWNGVDYDIGTIKYGEILPMF